MQSGMFGQRADLYDLIYSDLDYQKNAELLRDLLRGEAIDDGARLLEAACGTGAYLKPLSKWYDTAGFDLSPQMIERARRKLDGTKLFVADMEDYVADEPYATVVCLFSSIGYVHGRDTLLRTFERFYRSLQPGGIVIIEPWVDSDDYVVGRPSMKTFEDDNIKLCRQVVSQRRQQVAILDFHWLVARKNEEIDHFTERHELWMCTGDEMLETMQEAGFDARFQEGGLIGRGLFVGRRSSP